MSECVVGYTANYFIYYFPKANMQNTGKITLVTIQLAGLVLSALLVAATFVNPQKVEEQLQNFALARVEVAANEAWQKAAGQLEEGGRAERLGALAKQFGLQAEKIQEQREQIVPALMSYALSDRCGEDCAFAAIVSQAVNSAMIERALKLRVGQETIQDFIVEKYESSVRALINDLRRFGLVNIVALSLMISLVVIRNFSNWRFTAFSIALTGYTAWAAYGYVYKQNWALAILLQDWVAPGYQIAMICVSCLFFDWLFLRGKITEMVVSAVGSTLPG